VVQYFSGAIGFISIAAFALTAVLIVWFRMPETRQLVLKQSEQLNTAAAPSS
jgi:hypothetical protein